MPKSGKLLEQLVASLVGVGTIGCHDDSIASFYFPKKIRDTYTRSHEDFPPGGGLFLATCEGPQNDVMVIPVTVTVRIRNSGWRHG